MKPRIKHAIVMVLVLALQYFPNTQAASTIGSGLCTSSLTTTSGTFNASATQSGRNCVVIFKTTTNTSSAIGSWTVPQNNLSITYLVVGGGGSGSRGQCSVTYGGGGGGGQVVNSSAVFSGTLDIVVGAGGASYTSQNCPNIVGNAGSLSKFDSVSANGGAGAGIGKTGGSSGSGNAGGTASDSGCGECGAGGGGGAVTSGGGTGTINGLDGGSGLSSSISGSLTEYGSGGAGRSGSYYGVARGSGGSANSSGGSGSCDGLAGAGGGGSDCVYQRTGWGAGGSGTVILSYTFSDTSLTQINTSGTLYKGVNTTISVTSNVAGKVRFFVDGKRISTCLSVTNVGSYPNYTATCAWKPAVISRHVLSATITPTDNSFSSSTSVSSAIYIQKRSTTR